jgi:hypothetical protein
MANAGVQLADNGQARQVILGQATIGDSVCVASQLPRRSGGVIASSGLYRRTAKISLSCPIRQRVDIWNERWTSNLRSHTAFRFSFLVS